MTNKIFCIAAAALFALQSISFAETLIKDGFEKGAQSDALKRAQYEDKAVSFAEGKDALSGKKSLLLDTMGSGQEWPRSIRFFPDDIAEGGYYSVSFKFKVLELPEDGKNFLVIEGTLDGKGHRFGTGTFGWKAGAAGEFSFGVAIPKNGAKFHIDLTSHRGSKIIVDDILITRLPLPPAMDWMGEKDAFIGMRHTPLENGFFNPEDPMYALGKEKFFPFIDEFGQFMHKTWKNKIISKDDFKKRIEEEKAFDKAHPPLAGLDEFFGLMDARRKYKATGRFRVEKVDGKWFFITPKGNLFWSLGIDCVGEFSSTPIEDREFYFKDIADEKYAYKSWWGKFHYEKPHKCFSFTQKNIDTKYGGDAWKTYGATAARRMTAWGLNTYGAWSAGSVLENSKIPFAYILNSHKKNFLDAQSEMEGYWMKFPEYFDPSFETETKKLAAKKAHLINSPYCIGVFVDNELPWQKRDLDLARGVLSCPATQPSKIEFRKMLEKKYSDISALNKAWNADYSGWENLLERRDFFPKTPDGEGDMLAMEIKIYERYFEVCRAAVKEVSADTLYFGCRFAWGNESVARVASGHCDVVSYNVYAVEVSEFKLPQGCEDKPVIIGEYHFGNQDAGTFGGGLQPRRTLKEKVEGYEGYTWSAVRNPNIIGAHWFQWFDQLTTGRSDGENYAIGFVDVADTPIYEMALASRKISERMYAERLKRR